MTYPCLHIDLDKIEHNARTITELCREHGIEVTGVTKVICGNPDVAAAMLRGGVAGLADSRLKNLRRLRAAGIPGPFMLLRLPPLSAVEEVVQTANISLNSEPVVLRALSDAARRRDREHQVILMVELGDLREGVLPEQLPAVAEQVLGLPGIRLAGLGTNLACFSGVIPSEANMQRLVELAEELERRFAIRLPWISGINSSGLQLIATGRMPERVNHARIGEAILLGRETTHRRPWSGTFQDAFELRAEILELCRKPSRPRGERGEDAFGHQTAAADRGSMLRALVNVGREDLDLEGTRPLDRRLRILGASSGYLALDATEAEGELRVGDVLGFSLNYGALLAAMTSEYVLKQPAGQGAPPPGA